MALVPNREKPARGIVGTWANMEASNARSMFAAEKFVAGTPLTYGSDEMTVEVLDDRTRFIGIALATVDMDGGPENPGDPNRFDEGQLLGVADMGTVFVLAGETVTEGDDVYYAPSDGKYYKSSATGRIQLPTCEFDEGAATDEPVAMRIRIEPGAGDVTAA